MLFTGNVPKSLRGNVYIYPNKVGYESPCVYQYGPFYGQTYNNQTPASTNRTRQSSRFMYETSLTSSAGIGPEISAESAFMWSILSYDALITILRYAHGSVHLQYHNRPFLAEALIYNIQCAHEDCIGMQRHPQDILNGYVANERLIVKAWNEHRLGHATPQKILNATRQQASRLYRDEDNATDIEASFPIRLSASFYGVPFQYPSPLPSFDDPVTVASRMRAAQEKSTRSSTLVTPVTPVMHKPLTAGGRGSRTPMSSHSPDKYHKLAGAPSQNLPFPQAPANITIAELICFLPQWLKSIDVIDRAISNGGLCGTIAIMLNAFRDVGTAAITSNSVYRMMRPPMRKRGKEYENWTVGSHTVPEGHNPRSIGVAGFRLPSETHNDRKTSPASIPFKDLANNVKMLPQNKDALDLTRCIVYHKQPKHWKEVWNFPDDFDALVKHIGGPATITTDHQDSAVFSRWTSPNVRAAAERLFHGARDADGRAIKPPRDKTEDSSTHMKPSEYEDSHSDTSTPIPKKRGRGRPLKRHQAPPVTPVRRGEAVDVDSESDKDTFKGSRRADVQARENMKKKGIRRSARFSETQRVIYGA